MQGKGEPLITEQEAREIVQSWLSKRRLEVVVSRVDEYAWGWMFFYDSRAFVERGDESQRLLGNVPVYVTRDDGELHKPVAGSGTPPDEHRRIFEEQLAATKRK